MADSAGRLDRLAIAYPAARTDEEAQLAEWYAAAQYCEEADHWPVGTARAIGPFHRDADGHVRWEWLCPFKFEHLGYEASYANGIHIEWHEGATGRWPVNADGLGIVCAHFVDGSYWDARTHGEPPSARTLRAMVVTRARERGELALLERAVGPVAAWIAAV